MYNRIIYLAE